MHAEDGVSSLAIGHRRSSRALQLLLEEFFGCRLEKCNTFEDTAEDINMNADRISTSRKQPGQLLLYHSLRRDGR